MHLLHIGGQFFYFEHSELAAVLARRLGREQLNEDGGRAGRKL